MTRAEIKQRSELNKLIKQIERALKVIRINLKAKDEGFVNYNLAGARKLRNQIYRARAGMKINDSYEITESLRILSDVEITIDFRIPQ